MNILLILTLALSAQALPHRSRSKKESKFQRVFTKINRDSADNFKISNACF